MCEWVQVGASVSEGGRKKDCGCVHVGVRAL